MIQRRFALNLDFSSRNTKTPCTVSDDLGNKQGAAGVAARLLTIDRVALNGSQVTLAWAFPFVATL